MRLRWFFKKPGWRKSYERRKRWLESLPPVQEIGCPKCGYFWRPRKRVPSLCPKCRSQFSIKKPPILKQIESPKPAELSIVIPLTYEEAQFLQEELKDKHPELARRIERFVRISGVKPDADT